MSHQPTVPDRLNILFLPAWYPSPQLPVNGIFVREYAKAVSLNHNVAVLYLSDKAAPYCDFDDEGIRTVQRYVPFSGKDAAGRMIIGLGHYLWHGLRDFALLRRSFKPDLIHVQVAQPAGLLGLAISLRYGIPMLLTEHSNPFSMQMSNPIRRFLTYRVAKRARAITTVSRYLQAQMEAYHIKGPFTVVPNVVNTELFHPAATPQQSADQPKRILLVALLADYKGIPYLFDALAQLRKSRADFTLDIAGDGPQRDEYERLCDALQLGSVVRFMGTKSKPEVAKLMRECDFLVVSSLNETMGVSLIEALASGKPVVSTRCGGPEEVVSPEVGVLVDKASAEALAEGIGWMLDHYHDYDPQMIADYARRRYSYPAVADQFDAVYRRILADRSHNTRTQHKGD